jgi:hypothetical protein
MLENADCLPCKSALKKTSLRIDQCSPESRSSRSTQTFSDTTTTQDSLYIQRVTFTVVEVRTYEQFPSQGVWEHSDLEPVCINEFEIHRMKSKNQMNQVVENKRVEQIKLRRSSPFSSVLRTEKEIERARMLKEANKGWKWEKRRISLFGKWFYSTNSQDKNHPCNC